MNDGERLREGEKKRAADEGEKDGERRMLEMWLKGKDEGCGMKVKNEQLRGSWKRKGW